MSQTADVTRSLAKLSELKNTTTFLSQELFHFTMKDGTKMTIVPAGASEKWLEKNSHLCTQRAGVSFGGSEGLKIITNGHNHALVATKDDRWELYMLNKS